MKRKPDVMKALAIVEAALADATRHILISHTRDEYMPRIRSLLEAHLSRTKGCERGTEP